MLRARLAMNIDEYFDNQFVGTIASDVLTVTSLTEGIVPIGLAIYGANIASPCQISAQLSGTPNGLGTYSVTTIPDAASEAIYAGVRETTQKTEIVMQLDVHGPSSGDNAQRITTLMRDQFGVDAFAAQNPNIAPLYCDAPRMIPFTNGEQQYEERWTVDLHLQCDIAILVTQQFADQLEAQAQSAESLAS